MDAFSFYGQNHVLFLRRTVFRCGKKPPIQGPSHVAAHHARVRPSPSQAPWTRSLKLGYRRVERERENIVLAGPYAKFAQTPVMQPHLLDTGNRLLAEASPYNLVWGIRYRADHVFARQPRLWRGLNLLGKALQTVRHLFRDRAPPPTRHQPLSPQRDSPSSRNCIFEVDSSPRQRLCPEGTSAAASPSRYPTPSQTCDQTTAAMSSL